MVEALLIEYDMITQSGCTNQPLGKGIKKTKERKRKKKNSQVSKVK